MKTTLTKLQIQDYQKLCHERSNGLLLTPDWLRFICEANNYDVEKIGQYFLELLPTILYKD